MARHRADEDVADQGQRPLRVGGGVQRAGSRRRHEVVRPLRCGVCTTGAAVSFATNFSLPLQVGL